MGSWKTRAMLTGVAIGWIVTIVLIVRFPDLRAGADPRAAQVWFLTGTLTAVLTLQMTIRSLWPDLDRRYSSPWLRGSPSSNLAVVVVLVAYLTGFLLLRRP
jgi:hypothetical protein